MSQGLPQLAQHRPAQLACAAALAVAPLDVRTCGINQQVGSVNIRPSIITATITFIIRLSGFPALTLLPRFVLSGILMNLGIVVLKQWLWATHGFYASSGFFYVVVGSYFYRVAYFYYFYDPFFIGLTLGKCRVGIL